MAKCIGSVTSWSTKDLDHDVAAFMDSNLRVGENLIRKQIDKFEEIIMVIGNTYLAIERSALNFIDKIDCHCAQDLVISKLEYLYSVNHTVMKQLSDSNLDRYIKHRYYILYSEGVIEKLKALLMIVGRLSELNQIIFAAEQRKRTISEESITIHTLSTIWSAATTIMLMFRNGAKEIFKPEEGDSDDDFKFLLENLESFVAGIEMARLFAMDLTITSWIQFNRLVRYEDLLKGLPFLCLCHSKLYFSVLKMALTDQSDKDNFLKESLALIVDQSSKRDAITNSIREYKLIPSEVCFYEASKEDRAYFVMWHMYSLVRLAGDGHMHLIKDRCDQILRDNFNLAISVFIDKTSSQEESGSSVTSKSVQKLWLSPHQAERFKLLLSMINLTFEKNNSILGVLVKLFAFFDNYWHLFASSYYDNREFTIENLTIFQLLTKLMNDVIPMYTMDGQPRIVSSDECKTKEEKQLLLLWDQLLARSKRQETIEQTKVAQSASDKRQIE